MLKVKFTLMSINCVKVSDGKSTEVSATYSRKRPYTKYRFVKEIECLITNNNKSKEL